MSFGNRTSQALLNSLMGKTSNFGALASRPTIFVGLSSTTPTEAGGNVTEPTTGAYARVQTAPADWAAATLADPSVTQNVADINFADATADWLGGANLTHMVAFDALTGGNYLGMGALTTPKPVLSGDPVRFPAGDLKLNLT